MTTAARPTPHQGSVLGMIYRQTLHHEWATSTNVGCRGACQHLEQKGLIITDEVRGPRGGTTYRYRLTEAGRTRVPERFVKAGV